MNVMSCAFLVMGAAMGLIAYESAVRYAVPHRRETPASERSARVRGRSGRVVEAVGSLAAALERFAPLSPADADVCRDRLTRAGMAVEPETWRCAPCAGNRGLRVRRRGGRARGGKRPVDPRGRRGGGSGCWVAAAERGAVEQGADSSASDRSEASRRDGAARHRHCGRVAG